MKRIICFFSACIIIIIFLLNPAIVLVGASNGLILWFQTIVPTLLPFALMSSILLDLNMENIISKCLSPVTKTLLGISPSGNYVLFIGLLCGYPLGAATASRLIHEKRLSVNEGQYLVNFCNNLSPAFIISFVCGTLLNNTLIIPKVLMILYLTPVVLGIFTKHIYLKSDTPGFVPADTNNMSCCSISSDKQPPLNITDILDRAISNASSTLLKLGGYIIIFAIFSELINTSAMPYTVKLFTSAITEVTGGCSILASSGINTQLMIPLLLSLITFGGVSGIAQTAGITGGTGISIRQYTCFRLISAVTVFIITYIFF